MLKRKLTACNAIGAMSVAAVALAASWSTAAHAAGQVGLKAGDKVPAFDVQTITGALKGKTLCYV